MTEDANQTELDARWIILDIADPGECGDMLAFCDIRDGCFFVDYRQSALYTSTEYDEYDPLDDFADNAEITEWFKMIRFLSDSSGKYQFAFSQRIAHMKIGDKGQELSRSPGVSTHYFSSVATDERNRLVSITSPEGNIINVKRIGTCPISDAGKSCTVFDAVVPDHARPFIILQFLPDAPEKNRDSGGVDHRALYAMMVDARIRTTTFRNMPSKYM